MVFEDPTTMKNKLMLRACRQFTAGHITLPTLRAFLAANIPIIHACSVTLAGAIEDMRDEEIQEIVKRLIPLLEIATKGK